MTETEYWNRHLKPLLIPYLYVWKISASYIKGVPDWWASGSLGDLWVENKRLANDAKKPPPVLDLTDPKKYLTVHQQEWLGRRYHEGRNVGVVVFSKIGHLWLPDLTWQEPIPALAFSEKAMSKQHLADILLWQLGEVDKQEQTGKIA